MIYLRTSSTSTYLDIGRQLPRYYTHKIRLPIFQHDEICCGSHANCLRLPRHYSTVNAICLYYMQCFLVPSVMKFMDVCTFDYSRARSYQSFTIIYLMNQLSSNHCLKYQFTIYKYLRKMDTHPIELNVHICVFVGNVSKKRFLLRANKIELDEHRCLSTFDYIYTNTYMWFCLCKCSWSAFSSPCNGNRFRLWGFPIEKMPVITRFYAWQVNAQSRYCASKLVLAVASNTRTFILDEPPVHIQSVFHHFIPKIPITICTFVSDCSTT